MSNADFIMTPEEAQIALEQQMDFDASAQLRDDDYDAVQEAVQASLQAMQVDIRMKRAMVVNAGHSWYTDEDLHELSVDDIQRSIDNCIKRDKRH